MWGQEGSGTFVSQALRAGPSGFPQQGGPQLPASIYDQQPERRSYLREGLASFAF